MEYNKDNWSYKWFGVWKEYGLDYQNYPSVFSFVDAQANESYNKGMLVDYLNNCLITSATSRRNFPSPFDGSITGGSLSFRTDGQWVWLDNISDFITLNKLALSTTFYESILSRKFIVPQVTDLELANIHGPDL